MSGSSSKSLGRFVLSEVCSARYAHSRDTTRHFAIIILVICDWLARWSGTSTHCDRTSYHCSEIESTPPAHAVHADAPSGEQIGHSFMAGGLIRAWVRALCYVEWSQTVRGHPPTGCAGRLTVPAHSRQRCQCCGWLPPSPPACWPLRCFTFGKYPA
jgi:hypothetical protein